MGFRHPEVQRLRRLLRRRSARLDEGAFVVEGATALAEALGAGWDVEAVYVDAAAADPSAVASGVPVRPLGRGVVGRVATTKTPQSVLAVVRIPDRRLVPGAALVLVADGVADPGNLGTMLRSAEAAGFDAVVATPGTVDATSPKVVRSSAGAVFHIDVVAGTLDDVRAAGLRLVATSSHRGRELGEVDWSGRVAIVVGNEAHGLDDDAPVDEWVTIAHHGRAESLNVAMAATLLCFEASRRRRHPAVRPPG